jgi:uncharacterized protein YchJ
MPIDFTKNRAVLDKVETAIDSGELDQLPAAERAEILRNVIQGSRNVLDALEAWERDAASMKSEAELLNADAAEIRHHQESLRAEQRDVAKGLASIGAAVNGLPCICGSGRRFNACCGQR